MWACPREGRGYVANPPIFWRGGGTRTYDTVIVWPTYPLFSTSPKSTVIKKFTHFAHISPHFFPSARTTQHIIAHHSTTQWGIYTALHCMSLHNTTMHNTSLYIHNTYSTSHCNAIHLITDGLTCVIHVCVCVAPRTKGLAPQLTVQKALGLNAVAPTADMSTSDGGGDMYGVVQCHDGTDSDWQPQAQDEATFEEEDHHEQPSVDISGEESSNTTTSSSSNSSSNSTSSSGTPIAHHPQRKSKHQHDAKG